MLGVHLQNHGGGWAGGHSINPLLWAQELCVHDPPLGGGGGTSAATQAPSCSAAFMLVKETNFSLVAPKVSNLRSIRGPGVWGPGVYAANGEETPQDRSVSHGLWVAL